MDQARKEPGIFDCIAGDGSTLSQFQDANLILDEIQKGLNQYLETKRLAFPRFFFLSDEDLLDILSQTKDPLKVNDHLNKCFEAIDKVVFTENLEITTMISPEQEKIHLLTSIGVDEGDKKGNVELWMSELEKVMFKTVRDFMSQAYETYFKTPRT